MANGIFVAENMASTKLSSLLNTARYNDGAVNQPIQNGRVVRLVGLEAGEREIYDARDVAANTNPIVVVDEPVLEYDEQITRGLNDYTNVAGKTVRTRRLQVGDSFAVSGRAITPIGVAPAVGNFIATPAAGNLWAEVANAAGGQSVICEIVDSYVLGAGAMAGHRNITMYGCRVVVA